MSQNSHKTMERKQNVLITYADIKRGFIHEIMSRLNTNGEQVQRKDVERACHQVIVEVAEKHQKAILNKDKSTDADDSNNGKNEPLSIQAEVSNSLNKAAALVKKNKGKVKKSKKLQKTSVTNAKVIKNSSQKEELKRRQKEAIYYLVIISMLFFTIITIFNLSPFGSQTEPKRNLFTSTFKGTSSFMGY